MCGAIRMGFRPFSFIAESSGGLCLFMRSAIITEKGLDTAFAARRARFLQRAAVCSGVQEQYPIK